MNPQQFAELLAGATYRNVISREHFALAKQHGLVVVHGQSDDLMTFDGAIDDQLGAYNGGTAYLTAAGLLQNECDAGDDCPHHEERKKGAATIEALWASEGDYSWTFRTEIPHATFEITEDGEPYCRGIVFALADVAGAGPAVSEAEAAIRKAIADYHYALDTRQHGGVAADKALNAIQQALGVSWVQGAEAARRATQEAV